MNQDLANKIPRYMADFLLFCEECLGFSKNDKYGFVQLTEPHKKLCRFLQFDGHKNKLILMPRYTFKSCIITQGYSLWRLADDPNTRILIYSDSATKAQGFLQGIKNHIHGEAPNSKFRNYFPHWETDPHKGKWNESQIVVSVRDVQHVEPSVDTGGIESSKVGMHYDLIIFDDIVSDLNVTTKAQMDKVYDCYKKSLSLLKPGGEVLIVGTRWHFGDAYGRIIKENTGKFGTMILSAKNGSEYPFASIGLDENFISHQIKEQGSYIASCLYFNNPVDDSTALFKVSDFTFYDPASIDYTALYKTCTVDPAGEGGDFTGITVCGTDKEMNIYVLEVVNDHLKPNQIVDTIIKLSYKYRFSKLGVEDNFFKGMLEKEILLELDEHRKNKEFTPFSFETFTASAKRGEGKFNRIQALQPYHERGALRFPGENIETLKGSFSDLAYQMIQCTPSHLPLHDDAVDSLAYHVKLIRPGESMRTYNPKPGTVEFIVKKINEDIFRQNRLLPRQFRRKIEPVSL